MEIHYPQITPPGRIGNEKSAASFGDIDRNGPRPGLAALTRGVKRRPDLMKVPA
jgi:hypothetical protein